MKNIFSKTIVFAVMIVFSGSIAIGNDVENKNQVVKTVKEHLCCGLGCVSGGTVGAFLVFGINSWIGNDPDAGILMAGVKLIVAAGLPCAGALGGIVAGEALGRRV